jgi:MHS family proline/betaine transporter-like MFS transporter
LVAGLLSAPAFNQVGWRIPFLIGGVLGLVGLYCRGDLIESPVFMAMQAKRRNERSPLMITLAHHKLYVLRLCLLLILTASGNYLLIGYISTYLHVYLQYPLAKALQIQGLFNLVSFGLISLFAWLADRKGRRLLLGFAALGYLFMALPCFYALNQTRSWWYLLPLIICYCAEQSTMPATIVELFPAKARYTGISLGYNLTMALVGGMTPLINTGLIQILHNTMVPAYYLMAGAGLALIVIVWHLPKQYGARLALH